MKVIVCGAGQLGANVALYLASEGNHVIIIDQSLALIEKINDTLDIQAILGCASNPDVLEKAGAADADVLIAVTLCDEVNMMICQVGHSIFQIPTKIARVRNQAYLKPAWAKLFIDTPIDVVISPELEVARSIARRLQVPGAFEMIPHVDGKVSTIGILCSAECPLLYTPLCQLTSLFPDLRIVLVAIIRNHKPIIPNGNDQILPEDEVYFTADTTHVSRAMAAFGVEEVETRRIVILGGGSVGLFLAEEIEARFPRITARIIEQSIEQAQLISQQLNRIEVLQGDVLDLDILEEVNISIAETVIAVTNHDETNILASLLAKRHGCGRVITLINKNTYSPLVTNLGIDAVINPNMINVSTILRPIRRGRIQAVHSLGNGFAEIIEGEALETSLLVNKPLKDLKLPSKVIIGAIVQKDTIIIPHPSTIIRPGDRIVLLAAAGQIKKVEKLFTVQLEYF